MLTRMRSAVSNMIGGIMASGGGVGVGANQENDDVGTDLPLRFPYSRPEFLDLCVDELQCATDHITRPIVNVKESSRLPWSSGYAE
ncbi:protein phosphatase 1H isoform X1 [Tachysurus ichikawai]